MKGSCLTLMTTPTSGSICQLRHRGQTEPVVGVVIKVEQLAVDFIRALLSEIRGVCVL